MGIMAGVAIAGAALSAYGANKSAKAQEKAAKQDKKAGQEQRSFNYIAANEIMAIGRINAAEDRRQARLIASRAVAVAAAGGSVQDIDHLIADIYGEGAYRASVSLMDAQMQSSRLIFEGEQAAKYGASVASARRGQAAATRLSGWGSLLQTGASLYGGAKFGGTTTSSPANNLAHMGGAGPGGRF
jgi:hypothetical protein